jgi:pectin methylesterase-like acyl-CoA thioesterase
LQEIAGSGQTATLRERGQARLPALLDNAMHKWLAGYDSGLVSLALKAWCCSSPDSVVSPAGASGEDWSTVEAGVDGGS